LFRNVRVFVQIGLFPPDPPRGTEGRSFSFRRGRIPGPAGARPGGAPPRFLPEAQKDPRPCGPGILMMLLFISAQKEALRAAPRRDPGFLA